MKASSRQQRPFSAVHLSYRNQHHTEDLRQSRFHCALSGTPWLRQHDNVPIVFAKRSCDISPDGKQSFENRLGKVCRSMEPPCRFRSWMSSRHAFRLWKDACRLEWPLSSETSASFWSKRVRPGACPDVPSSQSLGFRVLQHEICLPLQLHLLWFCLPLFFCWHFHHGFCWVRHAVSYGAGGVTSNLCKLQRSTKEDFHTAGAKYISGSADIRGPTGTGQCACFRLSLFGSRMTLCPKKRTSDPNLFDHGGARVGADLLRPTAATWKNRLGSVGFEKHTREVALVPSIS